MSGRLLSILELAIAPILIASAAQADIIFVDMNRSPKEIESARVAAKSRGETLHVVPGDPSPAVKAEIAKLEIQIRSMRTAVERSAATATNQRQRQASRRDLQNLMQKRAQLTFMNPKVIGEKLDELKAQNRKVSALVISGHDGNGAFFGENGKLSAFELQKLLKERPEMAGDIRALYLWGCYTANFGSCEGHWKGAVPNLGIVVGFDGSAPAGDKKANHTYLQDSLQKEKKFTEAKDEKTLRAVFKSIRNINQMKAAVCVNDFLVNNEGASSTKEMSEACRSVFKEKKPVKWAERIACYRDGAPGCENVPADTRNGEIRKIYEEMQGSNHCRNMASESQDPDMQKFAECWPDPDEVLRLIHFKQVQKSAANLHAEEFQTYDAAIAEQGLPTSMQLGDVSKISRAELNKKMTDLQVMVAQTTSKSEDYATASGVKAAELKTLNTEISKTLSRMSTDCVSSHWVEPNATDRSPCLTKKDQLHLGLEVYEQLRVKADNEVREPVKSQIEELRNTVLAAKKAMNETTDAATREEAQTLINEKSKVLTKLVRGVTEKKADRVNSVMRMGVRNSPKFKETSLYQAWVYDVGESTAEQTLAEPPAPQAPNEEPPSP